MRRFWTRGRTRVLTLGAAIVVFLAVGASIGGAAIGGLVAAAPGKLAHGAHVFAGSSSSAQEHQYPKGKTTICHRTGSQSNPFVMITVSNHALPAHARHGDIIPAPAGGCPTTPTPSPEATPPANQAPESAQIAPKVKATKVHKAKKPKRAKHAKKHSVRSGLSTRSAETFRVKVKKAKHSKPHQVARQAQKAQKAQNRGNGNGGGNGNGRGNGNGGGNAGGKKK